MKTKSLMIIAMCLLAFVGMTNAQPRSIKKNVTHAQRPQLQLEAVGQLEKAVNYQPGVVYHRAATNTRDNVLYSNGFETSADLTDLSVWDYNEDDFTWGRFSGIGANGSTYALGNQSYDFDNQTAITPDDFVIMPAITLPTGGQYFAGVYAEAYMANQYYTSETMGIFVAPEGDQYFYQVGSDFTISSGSYEYCEVDLTAYAGQTIEIYIRHYNCSDGTYLFIDDFSVFEKVTEEEIYIGDNGTSNSSNVPTNTRSNYSLTQQIYTASEIGYTGGTITSVSFYSTGNSTRTLDIYMVNTTQSTISSSNYLTPTSSNKVVAAQSVSFTANAWTKITFDTPFEYTGGNVAIIVDDNTGSSSGNTVRYFRVFSASSQATYVNGSTNYNATSSSAGYSRNQNSKNQVKFTIIPPATLVESITASDISLMEGLTAQIDYTILPADATNQNVTFTSADPDVAEVDANGVVYAMGAGSTTITIAAVDGSDVSTTINVTVSAFVGLIFDFETDPHEEDWTFVDSDGDGYNWGWDYYETESGNSHMTPIEGYGLIYSESYHNNESGSGGTALTPDNWAITPAIHILNSPSVIAFYAMGQDANYAAEHVQIYAGLSADPSSMTAISTEFVTTGDAVQYIANIPDTYAGQNIYLAIVHHNVTDMFALVVDYVIVTNAELVPAGILVESISASDVTVLVGETATITPTVLPADATNPAVTYTSADATIATVEGNVVTGVAPGNTTITIAATDGSNVSTTINVTVNGIDVTGITADDVTLAHGETATISYTVAPANASDQSVTFTSANTAIATVEGNVVTGVTVGTTTITIASVSNPEITAEITVTVTSDPNAVQFTVNAPATAHPGDVITVAAVLTAPTNGTYGGFTDLLMAINYDHTAFAFVNGSIVYGPVIAQAQQYNSQISNITNVTDKIQVAINCYEMGYYVTAEGIVFSAQFTVLAETGEFTFTGEPNGYMNFDHEIEGGGGVEYIAYEATPSTVNITSLETYTKHITGYGTSAGGYYLIASPLATDVDPEDVTNMLTADEDNYHTYDLFYFDQAGDSNGNEWINYRVDEFDLVAGKGYLYANKHDVDLIFTGAASTETEIQVPLEVKDCSNASGHFVGWNLVGNPFGHPAYTDRDFYVMNTAGSQIIAEDSRKVDSIQGIFVIATTDGEEMTFTTTNPSNAGSKVVMNVMDNQGLADRAIVRFGEGSQLPKFQLFGNTTKVYFPEDDQDYAVVHSANENELPVNFKASSNGTYTMSVNIEDVDMDYIHLIDNQTRMDVDLLQTPSYTFEATTSDSESRFLLVFATVDGVNENHFGFINASGNLCIYGVEGKATLQVIDMLGHVLSTEQFSGSYEKHLNVAPGVYMIRLIQGNDIKVQKMVVR